MEREQERESPPPSEVSALRAKVAELEAQLAARRQAEEAPGQLHLDPTALLDAIPAMVFVKRRDHRYALVNQAYTRHYRLRRDAILGKRDEEIFPPATALEYHDNDEAVMASGLPRSDVELPYKFADGSEGWTLEHNVPLRDASARVVGMVGVAIDVTARKQAEEALHRSDAELRAALARQDELIATIMALSTPVLPIDDHVLVLPLVGHVDAARSARIMEALLAGVQRYRAAFVIVDLTGVPFVDAAVAGHLLRAAQAVGLLGARCIVVGLSPAIAQSLAQQGVDLRGIVTLGDLQTGIRYAQRAPGASPGSPASR